MKINFIYPKKYNIKELSSIRKNKVINCFDEETLKFLKLVSNILRKNPLARQFPEVLALSYWLRPSQIKSLKKIFYKSEENYLRVARGVALHITPSNVDVMFMYSLTLSMLVGNTNIVKLSSKNTPQSNLIISSINEALKTNKFLKVKKRLVLIKYEHDNSITKLLSDLCDLRVIWGGDDTINVIRSIILKPKSTEVVFSDKTSISVFDCKSILKNCLNKMIENFFNDTFTFGQMACSSPRGIIWIGSKNDIKAARKKFWKLFKEYVDRRNIKVSPMESIDKLINEQSLAFRGFSTVQRTNNINNIYFNDIKKINLNDHSGPGFFQEAGILNIKDINTILSKHIQSIASYGIEKTLWENFIYNNNPKGIDRIIDVGKALNFDNNWDGMNLMNRFSRLIDINIL